MPSKEDAKYQALWCKYCDELCVLKESLRNLETKYMRKELRKDIFESLLKEYQHCIAVVNEDMDDIRGSLIAENKRNKV